MTLILAFSFVVAGVPLPASSKVCPCCAKAEAGDCGATHVQEPMGCCQMKAAVPGDSVTLNTVLETSQGHLLAPAVNGTAPSYLSLMRDIPTPDYGRWAFKSPPVYVLTSTYLC